MRAWVAGAVAASALASGMTVGGVVAAAAADNFPTRALTIIVPWPPGASNDLSARAIANQMSQVLGQSYTRSMT